MQNAIEENVLDAVTRFGQWCARNVSTEMNCKILQLPSATAEGEWCFRQLIEPPYLGLWHRSMFFDLLELMRMATMPSVLLPAKPLQSP